MKNISCYNIVVFLLTLIFQAGLLLSCTNREQKARGQTARPAANKQQLIKPPSSYTDTIKPGFPVAVFYHPDSLQVVQFKKVNDSMVFASIIHENFYQMRNSRIILSKYYLYIKQLEVTNARYLLFEKAGGEKICIDLDTRKDPFGLIVFDGRKDPLAVDMTNIDSELGFYFVQKPVTSRRGN